MEYDEELARRLILGALGELPRKGVNDIEGFRAVVGSLVDGAGRIFHEMEKMPELIHVPSRILDKLELLGVYLEYLKRFIKGRRI